MSPHKIQHDDDSQDGEDRFERYSANGSMSEPTMPFSDREADLVKCHWLGNIMFRAILAEDLGRKTDAKSSMELTSELEGRICDFPYDQCLRDLDAIKDFDIPSDGQQTTSALMKAVNIRIGIVMSENDAEARRNLVQLLQGGGCASSAFANAVEPRNQARMQYAVQPVSAPHPVPAAELPQKQLAMYTMRLNEWAGLHNYTIRYTYDHVSVDPPLWECTAHCPDGEVLKDIGKNKTIAKHMASMKVCNVRKLRV